MRTVRLVVLRGRKRVRAHCVQRRSHATCVCARAIACRVGKGLFRASESARARVCVCSFVCVSKRRRMCVYLCLCACGCVLTPHVRVRCVTSLASKKAEPVTVVMPTGECSRHALFFAARAPRWVRTAGSLGSAAYTACVLVPLRWSVALSIHPCVASLCAFRSAKVRCLSRDMLLHCAALCARSNYSREYFRAQ